MQNVRTVVKQNSCARCEVLVIFTGSNQQVERKLNGLIKKERSLFRLKKLL